MSSFLFVLRIALAWGIASGIALALWSDLFGNRAKSVLAAVAAVATILAIVNALSHIRRVRLIANRVDATTLSSRHRRQIEIPHPAGEAFDVVEAAIRELPRVEAVYPVRDSLQVRARLRRASFWWMSAKQRAKRGEDDEMRRNGSPRPSRQATTHQPHAHLPARDRRLDRLVPRR